MILNFHRYQDICRLKVVSGARIKICLFRSEMVGSEKNLTGKMDDKRVSENGWLLESDSWAFAKLTERIESYMNLEATSESGAAELYQVGNFNIFCLLLSCLLYTSPSPRDS